MSHDIVTHAPLWVLLVIALAGLPIAAVIVQAGLRRAFPVLRGREQNEVVGFLLAVVGVGYAVVAGLMIVTLWEQFADARAQAVTEANKLQDVVANANVFGQDTGGTMRALALTYAHEVVDHEWASMVQGKADPAVRQALEGMTAGLATVNTLKPVTNASLIVSLSGVNELRDAREKRLRTAQEDVPGVLWLALLVSGTITLGFCLLFGGLGARQHYVMAFGVAAVISVGLLAIVLLDQPYSGDVAVHPEAFERVIQVLAVPDTGPTTTNP